MTEEKQGAAEWLRGIIEEYEAEKSFNSCSLMAKLLGIECGDTTCRECTADMMKTVADRIDAERALPEGIEWPRFEDGELVKIGDEVEYGGKALEVDAICFDREEGSMALRRNLDISRMSGSYGERVKRPAPKVLDADGAPINVGDVVYFVGGSGVRYAVKDIGFEPDGAFVDIIDEEGRYSTMANPEKLTHERPDSWEQLEKDAYHLVMSEYLETPEKDVGEIVRRAKALAKAGE